MDLGVTQEYINNIDKAINDIRLMVSDGGCANFETYKKQTGIIQGLERAKDILHDTLKSFSTDYQDLNDDQD